MNSLFPMTPLRTTSSYIATRTASGVRITARSTRVLPRTRVVSEAVWLQLAAMSDASFDGSCVLELGIGTFARPSRRRRRA